MIALVRLARWIPDVDVGRLTLLLVAGMTVMADVITGEKTILQYLLKPIHLSLQTAFRER